METLFNNVDIVIYFFITIILIHRIYLVLGSRQGHEVKVNHQRFTKTIKNKQQELKVKKQTLNTIEVNSKNNIEQANSASSIYKKMLYVEKVFQDFEYISFIKEKQEDFELIISAYRSKNLESVKNKITNDYFAILQKASLEIKGSSYLKVNDFKEVDISNILFEEKGVKISVKFNTDYEIISNDDNKVIEEDSNNTEYWTFVRDYNGLNWNLIDIRNE